jgi:hypothetical protein
MDDLIVFLRARLDEDAAAAKRVESRWRQIGETGVIVASDGTHAEECANGNWTGIAEHIVRHDPARVLADADAKRQMIRLHGCTEGHECSTVDRAGDVDHCTWVMEDEACTTLRLLALPYADHPDYRDEWRP